MTSKYAQDITNIVKGMARIEGILEEGVIKRLDKLNGTQDKQWSEINKNSTSIAKNEAKVEDIKETLEGHSDNPGAHGAESARVQARAVGTNARALILTGILAGVASVVGALLTIYLGS